MFFAFTYLDFAFRGTFEELSAVPTDVLEEEALEAQTIQTEIEDQFNAVPLVNDPDPDLFGAPASAADAVDAEPVEVETE